MKTTRFQDLTRHLRSLQPADLHRVGGGESASTSTSGTPAAGDDTVGDAGGAIPMTTFSLNFAKVEYR